MWLQMTEGMVRQLTWPRLFQSGILREQVSHRCPSGTAIPREEQPRLQFWPKTPKPCISFAVHWMTKCPLFGPKWQFQKSHEDKHYAAAIFIYLCGYAIKLKTTVQQYAQTSREDQRTGISNGGCREREESSCSCGYRAQLGRKALWHASWERMLQKWHLCSQHAPDPCTVALGCYLDAEFREVMVSNFESSRCMHCVSVLHVCMWYGVLYTLSLSIAQCI